jgi:hypothetical protein
MFHKTSVFDHPDVRSVEFHHWPVPHYFIVGMVEGVLSAMRRRFTYFIQLHAVRLFKEVSADSLISRPNAHLLPASLIQHPLSVSRAHLPSLRFLPQLEPIPSLRSTNPVSSNSSSEGSCWGPPTYTDNEADDWDPEVRDVIPPINYRRYDPAIDGELYTPPTPPPVDAPTDEPNDLLTPINPPVAPMEPEK